MSELRTIPNIGACTEQDLILMGYTTIASLRGKSAEELYAEECRLRGCTLDRCRTKRKKNCGDCPDLPCGYFVKDPTVSDEQNEANLCKMVERLRADVGNNINYANRTDE